MANLGGAVLPAGMGLVIDHSAVRWGFLVPLAAFLYLTVLASLRGRPASGAAGSASAPCPL
jgi:fucose permease